MAGTPCTLRDIVLSDLSRAQNLVTKVHPDPIDPQFRIATPDGDYWIAITLTENQKERSRRLALVSDFMAFKLSFGFTVTAEMHEPDCLLAVGLLHNDFDAVLTLIERAPLAFSKPKLVPRASIDPLILGLRPRGSRTITSAREKELFRWFGIGGKFPAVLLERDGTIPR